MMLGLMSGSSRSAWTQRVFTKRIRKAITIIQQQALLWLPGGGVGGAVAPPVDCSVTVEQALSVWTQCFQQHGISEPLLSSHYIIAHVLGKKTLQSVETRRLRERLGDKEKEDVWALCSKRLTRMPVQYVIEEWDFRDLTLKMRPPVFIPRPETEELVSLVLKDLQSQWGVKTLRCLEVGCGSGAISLSLLHSVPQLKAVALDQSQAAVRLTKENADRLGLLDRLEVYHLDIMKEDSVLCTGLKLDSLVTVAEERSMDKILNIMDDASHPLHTVINNKRSLFSDRMLLPKCRTNRFKNSFVHHAIRLYSSSLGGRRGNRRTEDGKEQ
ncbi:MTRF1L release factor glutamine methyltransferase isoform X3 [Neoarius graeffei]|uniref:MTRF1L release factor glutamine methyltransferase isoform X3 n=1 Tax=Neoarius graeffei TaxID=443677 RepID=UPI00298CC242|nr:MTRF1L release factor glutamine methyltransferase isoform X3 [Neoarius graeffei]